MTKKKIVLHPTLPNGEPDLDTNLYPVALDTGIRDIDGNMVTFQRKLPNASTAGKVLTSTNTSGGVEWSDVSINEKDYISLIKRGPYLYEITFDTLPEYIPPEQYNIGGCTSYVKNGKLYRNLDWTYSNTAEFLVKFKDVEGMSFIDGMNDGELDSERLGQLPYRMCDGRNSSGLMVSTHVLFNDFEYEGSGNRNVPITLLPFLVLTTMTDVNTLSLEVTNLLNNMSIPQGLSSLDMLIQVLVTDGETTKLFTPTDNGYSYIDISENPKLTNFKWLNKETVERNDEDLQLRPTGIERWNLLADSSTTLEDLRFTLAYQYPNRLSEFIGENGTDKDSTDEELTAIYQTAYQKYHTDFKRDGTLWQTMHSIVYSQNGIESLCVQENYGHVYCDSISKLYRHDIRITYSQGTSNQFAYYISVYDAVASPITKGTLYTRLEGVRHGNAYFASKTDEQSGIRGTASYSMNSTAITFVGVYANLQGEINALLGSAAYSELTLLDTIVEL